MCILELYVKYFNKLIRNLKVQKTYLHVNPKFFENQKIFEAKKIFKCGTDK